MGTSASCTLICVGSELLRGKINTHASTLARRFAAIGLDLAEEHTVPDDQALLAERIRQALATSDVVIVTGGLGPTFDDLSREAASDATGRTLTLSKKLLGGIARKFRAARLRRMPPTNARQAYLLEGAQPIENSVGTAPGQWLTLGPRRVLILLPGPPSELKPMLENFVLPQLAQTFRRQPRAEAHLHFVGVAESIVDQKIRPIIKKAEKSMSGEIRFTILAHLGLVDFDIFLSASTVRSAKRRLATIVDQIRRKMGSSFYGMDPDYPLEKVVGDQLRRHRSTLALAESCTGGMLMEKLTDNPGSSAYLLGGMVVYSDAMKREFLNVPQTLLTKYGAVSKQAALAMAVAVRERSQATWALSITGIAGPGGGSRGKPVGLVYMALVGRRTRRSFEFRFGGSREVVRQRAVIAALDILRRAV